MGFTRLGTRFEVQRDSYTMHFKAGMRIRLRTVSSPF